MTRGPAISPAPPPDDPAPPKLLHCPTSHQKRACAPLASTTFLRLETDVSLCHSCYAQDETRVGKMAAVARRIEALPCRAISSLGHGCADATL